MTHHTDAQLLPCPFCGSEAHFEMDDDRWEWIECGSCGMQGNRSASLMEDCKPKLAEAWNRRAPAAPVPQCEPVGSVYTMEALVPGGREVHHVSLYMPLPAGTKLYAAPQPPEAAPVQLPEPQAEIEVRSMKTYLDLSIHEWRDTLPDGAYNIYTEQQLRELLAAHGIQERST